MRKENKNGSTTRSDAQINRDIILQEIHASIAAEYYCITVVVVIRRRRRQTKNQWLAATSDTLQLTAEPQLLRTAPAATPIYPRLIAHDGQRP